MRTQIPLFALALTLFVHVPPPAFAQGAAIVRIPDGQNHCIDPSRERVWLTMRRLITQRTKSWFSADDSVAILIKADVATDPADRRVTYPLMSEATFGAYPTGQLSVPVEYSIISGLRLLQGEYLYTGLSVDLTLLNIRRRNSWGNALKALADITDKLPIPASPIVQAGSYLLEFANSAVDADLEDQDADDKARTAALALNFDPTGTCGNGQEDDFETTGTLAVLQSTGVPGPALVPVDRTDEYCWDADLRPAFTLRAARERAGVPCTDPSYDEQYTRVTNDYVGFFLNARPATDVLSGPRADAYTIEAYDRCRAHGVMSVQECFR